MLRLTNSLDPLWRNLDGLVHETVVADVHEARRHRDFIASHLAAGLLALLALTAFLAVAGRPSLAAAIAFLWLAAPLPIAFFLSRTGRLAAAQFLSSAALAGFLAYVATLTGGLASPVILWFAVIPAEAALAGSKRITAVSALVAGAALAAVALVDFGGLLPVARMPDRALTLVVAGGALLYAASLALRLHARHAGAEQRMRDGEGRYRLLADNATDLITRHDLSGDVEFASPSARALTGCAPSELEGRGLFERVQVADRPAFLQAFSEADRTGRSMSVEFRVRRGEPGSRATYSWLEMRCRPAVDPVDGRRMLVAVTREITQRKDAEAAFEGARGDAEQASRAKDQFLANMSHELRTPLNAIIGFSDILREELAGRAGAERHHDYARLIHASGEHLLEVVNAILDMSKIEAGGIDLTRERFALGSVVDSAVEMLSQQIAARKLRIARRIGADLPDILADRRACRQILLNLLSNAIKFTEPGGRVSVAARLERGSFVIEVADDGIGISAADLPRIGTPFVQVDARYGRRYEGTGLGLSVVKGLVALHGGTLSIASTLGQGTTVTVRLPADLVALQPVGRFDERERKIA